MIHAYKYISHFGLKQEIKIIFVKPWMLSTFCAVGGGFSILQKKKNERKRFSSRFNDISSVYAVTGTYECTFLKYNKVSAIKDVWEYMVPEPLP